MSDTPRTDALREVIIGQYKEDELTGNGMGNILAALTDIETLERERDKHHKDADAFLDKWSKAQERAIDAERELDEAQQYVKELYIEMDGLFNHISFLQDALHKAREQYRLSSVCRELKAENERLKRIVTWPHDSDPFTSPDHDNDQNIYQ